MKLQYPDVVNVSIVHVSRCDTQRVEVLIFRHRWVTSNGNKLMDNAPDYDIAVIFVTKIKIN